MLSLPDLLSGLPLSGPRDVVSVYTTPGHCLTAVRGENESMSDATAHRDDGHIYWSVADLTMELDRRPSEVRAAIETLQLEKLKTSHSHLFVGMEL
jgi:hypothetical protein